MMKKNKSGCSSCRFQEIEGAHDIGFDEICRVFNGAIHMGLGRKMADGVDAVTCKNFPHLLSITDIRPNKNVASGIKIIYVAQVLGVPRVGELINIDDSAPEIRLPE